jgi:hypothetical protein
MGACRRPSVQAVCAYRCHLAACDGATIVFMTTKERFLRLADELSEVELEDMLRYAARQHEDPLVRRLDAAPLEDEEITPEEEAAVQESRDEIAAGAPLIPLEQVMRELGDA